MVVISKIALAVVGLFAAPIVAQITNGCPDSQQLISNNKCCPGPAVGCSGSATCCCIPDGNSISLSSNGVGGCKATINVNDSNYDQEVKDAMSGSGTSQSASSTTAAGTSGGSTPSATVGVTISGTGAPSASSGAAICVQAANGGGAHEVAFGLFVGLAAVPVAMHGF